MHIDEPWNNPLITGLQRLSAHSPWSAYANEQQALKGEPSPHLLSLNGTWAFKLSKSPKDMPQDLLDTASPDNTWLDMSVPSNWQLHPDVDEHPMYANMNYPFPEVAPTVPEVNPTGWYRHSFKLPSSWDGRDIILHFESCDSACKVWLNGQEVGYSQDSKLPHEFDLTPYLQAEENHLAVMVLKYCDGFYLEKQDYWHLSGIQRDVSLVAKPKARIQDMIVRTSLHSDTTPSNGENGHKGSPPATVNIRTFMNDLGQNMEGYAVRSKLYSPQGRLVGEACDAISLVSPMYAETQKERGAALSTITVKQAELWTAETPSLYTLTLTLVAPNGDECDFESTKVGIRELEISDRQLKLNGKRLILRGVCRHEHHPAKGRALSKEDMRAEIIAMKKLNFNAVRTSHYPNHSDFYDLCDELGLYVVDEANLETHGIEAQLSKDPLWMNAFNERLQRMVQRDKNHPSIIAWSLGNESSYGPHHASMAAWAKAYDPTRPVQYESGNPGHNISDIMVPMYPTFEWIEEIMNDAKETRPFITCEYAYSKGNALGNFKKYWDLVDQHLCFQGGFIWDWAEKTLYKNIEGVQQEAYGNEFDGGIGPDGHDYGSLESPTMCMNGVVMADLTPKPGAYEVAKVQSPIQFKFDGKQELKVVNQHHNIDLSAFDFTWELLENGVVVKSGKLEAQTPAGSSEVLTWPLGEVHPKIGVEIHLNLRATLKNDCTWAKAGHDIAWEQWTLAKALLAPQTVTGESSQKVNVMDLKVEEQERGLCISSESLSVVFQQGRIQQLEKFGQQLLTSPVEDLFNRARLDNDFINGDHDQKETYYKEWQNVGLDQLEARCLQQRHGLNSDGSVSVDSVVEYLHREQLIATVKTHHLITHETCEVHKEVELADCCETFPRVGVSLSLLPQLKDLRWLGRGPWESYVDRQDSALVGNYQSTVSEQFFPFVYPTETGCHTETRWLELRGGETSLKVQSSSPFNFSALEHHWKAIAKADHIYELPASKATELIIDCAHTGLGGDTGWTKNVHEEYLVKAGVYRYNFKLS